MKILDWARSIPATPRDVFLAGLLLATAGTTFAFVAGYQGRIVCLRESGFWTIPHIYLMLGGGELLVLLTSTRFAAQHDALAMMLGVVLGVIVYSIPELTAWVLSRKRSPWVFRSLSAVWVAFYLASLFLLFPTKDGL